MRVRIKTILIAIAGIATSLAIVRLLLFDMPDEPTIFTGLVITIANPFLILPGLFLVGLALVSFRLQNPARPSVKSRQPEGHEDRRPESPG